VSELSIRITRHNVAHTTVEHTGRAHPQTFWTYPDAISYVRNVIRADDTAASALPEEWRNYETVHGCNGGIRTRDELDAMWRLVDMPALLAKDVTTLDIESVESWGT
jgi:hypothetical protein